MSSKILIVDDDPDICQLLKRYLGSRGYDVSITYKGKEAISILKKETFDLVLCDLRLPDIDGFEVLEQIAHFKIETKVILITGYSDVKLAVKAIKKGAIEYVTKPIHPEEILHIIESAIATEKKSVKQEAVIKEITSEETNHQNNLPEFLQTESTVSQNIEKLIKLVAPTEMTVLITGESGTGKELAARKIHKNGKRSDKPFVAVDCGALPKDLAGSELFGHVKGAFTGALNDKTGHFERAEGGTLFLDEVGNLSYENQVRLLRVLQERQIRKIGGGENINVDVRIIAATNEDLKKAMQEDEFRDDIYYRLNEFKIDIPPLRERKSDIMEFADFFLKKSNQELGKTITGFNKQVTDKIMKYSWPGNLREMRNTIKRATLLAQGKKITGTELPQEIIHFSGINIPESNTPSFIPGMPLKEIIAKAEKKIILEALKHTRNNKSKTAELLKIDRKTLYNKMSQYDLIDPEN